MAPDISSYDKIIVAFSGGKDSLACLLHLFELGVPRNKIELWHHDIDGQSRSFMDWPCTTNYCKAVAAAFKLPIYLSWKHGGFEREMLRENSKTAPISWEQPSPNGGKHLLRTKGGDRGKDSTRRKFPQVSADLRVRWCSAYLKIDVCDRALRNSLRFEQSRTLVLTGERAEESTSRAKYKTFEPHRADNRNGKSGRHIDAWRPVHSWTEKQVWELIEKYRINTHPAYRAGWGRVSCASCIFGSANQWASLARIAPSHVHRVIEYEDEFGVTIKRNDSIMDLVGKGDVYPVLMHTEAGKEAGREAMDKDWSGEIILPAEDWKLPAGAYGEATGPT